VIQKERSTVAAGGRLLAVLLLSVFVLGSLPTLADSSYLEVSQSVSPQEIYVSGTGKPDTAIITVSVKDRMGVTRCPVDLLLVIDSSATAQIAKAKEFAFDLIDCLSDGDRVGLVSFSTSAELVMPLTYNLLEVKRAIEGIDTGGKSAFGDALEVAREELLGYGRSDAVLAEVLLVDGQSNVGRDPAEEGDLSAQAGIRIISVGIGYVIDSNLLEEFAAKTNGEFFKRPASYTIPSIQDLLTVTARATNVVLKKTLPYELSYIGSIPSATRVITNADGSTSLTFNIGNIGLAGEWKTDIEVQATRKGKISTDIGPMSLSYLTHRGVSSKIDIPSSFFTAVVPPAPPSPPVADFSYSPAKVSTTDTVMFTDKSQDTDGEIVAWEWRFGDDSESEVQNVQHSYSHSGTYTVTLVVTDDDGRRSAPAALQIVVQNAPPKAVLEVDPSEPRMAVSTMLDASGSYDADGNIVSYAWDLDGDGAFDVGGASSDVEHVFTKEGKHTISLKVTDNEGESDVLKQTVNVIPGLSVLRDIETCLPEDEIITGEVARVRITVTANTRVHGLTVHEDVPDGWAFAETEGSTGTLREDTMDWLFMETLEEGDTRVIEYSLTAPAICNERTEVALSGVVKSSSPRLTLMVTGENKVALVPSLPVKVVISRWEVEQDKIDLCLPKEISFAQIQYAVSLWLSGEPVAYTGGEVVTLDDMRDLIAYWLMDKSVHDPLY
jgi:PKD repeat protein